MNGTKKLMTFPSTIMKTAPINQNRCFQLYSMNNNKRQNDVRKYKKRKGRVKIIKNEGQVSKPQMSKANKQSAKHLTQK